MVANRVVGDIELICATAVGYASTLHLQYAQEMRGKGEFKQQLEHGLVISIAISVCVGGGYHCPWVLDFRL